MVALKREAFGDCIAKVGALAGVDENTAFGIIQEVAAHGDRLRKEGRANPFQAAAEELAAIEKRGAIQTRIDALQNAIKRNRKLQEAQAAIDTGKDVIKLIKSWLYFVPGADRNDSIESKWHALRRHWQSGVGNILRKEGLEDIALSGELDDQIAEHKLRLNGGTPNKDVTVSPQATRIAETIWAAETLATARLNDAGAHIGHATDYVAKMTHDPRALRLAAGSGKTDTEAFEAWYKDAQPWFGAKTFDHIVPEEGQSMEDARKQFMHGIYLNLIEGVHFKTPTRSGFMDNGKGYVPPTYEGTHNIARTAAKERVIYWKDAASANAYMKKYGGYKSLYEQSFSTLDHAARGVALMEHLGTNPEGNFNQIIKRLIQKNRNNPTVVEKLKAVTGPEHYGFRQNLNTTLDYLTGAAHYAGGSPYAQWYHHIAEWVAATKLGGVILPHITSAPFTVSSEMAQHGESRLNTIGRVLRAPLTGRGPQDVQDHLAEANAYNIGFNLKMSRQYQPNSGVPGAMTYAAANFMRFTGLPRVVDRLHADGVTGVHMRYFGTNADKEFSQLHPLRQNMLKRYGITSEDWDLLRKTPADLTADNDRWLSPKAASMIDAAATEKLLRKRGVIGNDYEPYMIDKAVQRYKWSLGDKYGMYINDSAERATVTPGVREQALMLRGMRPGSLGWMAARSFAQFKMWPLAAVNQIIGREIAWGLGAKGVAANLGWLFALATIGGALRLTVNDALAGRPQRNFMEPDNLLTAFGMGGGLGLYGDILFGEVGRSRSETLADVLGPLASDASGILTAYSKFREDLLSPDETQRSKAVQHALPAIARGTVNSIPFANLFYLKGSLDYLAFYHMYEAASPGWWERTNRRLEKENNNTMLGYKPGQPIPYGIPYVTFGLGQGQQ